MKKNKVIKSVYLYPENSKVFIYGAGSSCKALIYLLERLRRDIEICGIIDSFKEGKYKKYKIFKFSDFLKNNIKYDYIIIASLFSRQISENLFDYNLENHFIFQDQSQVLSGYLMESRFAKLINFSKRNFVKCLQKLFFIKSNKIIILGEYGSNFVGNCKYMFLYLLKRNQNVFYLVDNKEQYRKFSNKHLPSLMLGKISTFIHLLTCKVIFVDNSNWTFNDQLLNWVSAKKVQLWHGVGFKYIELMLVTDYFSDKFSLNEKEIFKKRYCKYDYLITTSQFYAENVFSPAFNIDLKNILLSGHSRNDQFYTDDYDSFDFDKDIKDKVINYKQSGMKIVIYTPTFRDKVEEFFFFKNFDLKSFNEFLKQNKIIMILKGHSIPHLDFKEQDPNGLSNIMQLKDRLDIYPILKVSDLMITDYSSIYMDYLHARKPIIFFTYDLSEYRKLHRQLQFDYDEMTPGPKAKNQNELVNWIKHFLVDNKDGFEKDRTRVFNLAFKYHDGNASERIYKKVLSVEC